MEEGRHEGEGMQRVQRCAWEMEDRAMSKACWQPWETRSGKESFLQKKHSQDNASILGL